MQAIITFDYAAMPAEQRAWLRDKTAAVRTITGRIAGDIVTMGSVLLEVRRRIGHGRFKAWCASELPWSYRQTARMMQVGRAFGSVKEMCQRGTFDRGALYLLALPSTPEDARNYAVQQLQDGRSVTVDDAREILKIHRRVPDLPRGEAKTLAPDQAEDKRPVTIPAKPDPVAEALAVLYRTCDSVHIGRLEEEDGTALATVTVHRGGRPETAVGETLLEVLQDLAGQTPRKACRKCRRTKPLTQFSHDQRRPDGRNQYCKKCEASRLREHKRKRRAADPS